MTFELHPSSQKLAADAEAREKKRKVISTALPLLIYIILITNFTQRKEERPLSPPAAASTDVRRASLEHKFILKMLLLSPRTGDSQEEGAAEGEYDARYFHLPSLIRALTI